MSAPQRPGWAKPYVGCITGRDGAKAVVAYRGTHVRFDTWAEAIEYADNFVRGQAARRANRIARRQNRDG